jgi:hypothetical protein
VILAKAKTTADNLTNQKSPAMQIQLCDVGYGYVFIPKQLVNSEAN